ncbi:MAG: DUF2635 domain-containing protein [Methylibium sp.]
MSDESPLLASMFVVPAAGLTVLDPDTRMPLGAEGGHVPRTTYWLRRLREGDVVELAAEPGKPGVKPVAAKASSKTK